MATQFPSSRGSVPSLLRCFLFVRNKPVTTHRLSKSLVDSPQSRCFPSDASVRGQRENVYMLVRTYLSFFRSFDKVLTRFFKEKLVPHGRTFEYQTFTILRNVTYEGRNFTLHEIFQRRAFLPCLFGEILKKIARNYFS